MGQNYEIISPIGQGAYGVVVAARVKNMSALNASNSDNGSKDGGADNEPTSPTSDGARSVKSNEYEMVAIKKIML